MPFSQELTRATVELRQMRSGNHRSTTAFGMSKISKAPSRGTHDYVIIGSGSAGSVLAGRKHRVLLLEAGPSDQHIHIRMPAALPLPLTNDRFDWFYTSEPEPCLGSRTVLEACGRVLGGSSSINGMNWVRGNSWDYDNREAPGLKGWSYKDVLPCFRKAGGRHPPQEATAGSRRLLSAGVA